ncbi:integrase core domain-containing protein [Sphingobacterium sp. InxBP1]|nr:integrase core domain-containing protein [Sphingobacterium sp. InxBP1]
MYNVISRPGKPTDNPYIESFNGSFVSTPFFRQLILDFSNLRY